MTFDKQNGELSIDSSVPEISGSYSIVVKAKHNIFDCFSLSITSEIMITTPIS